MKSFKLQYKSLYDRELSSNAKIIYLIILGKCVKGKTTSTEVYNSELMDILRLSETQVKKYTRELVDKKYLNKEIKGTSTNRRPNTYTIIE